MAPARRRSFGGWWFCAGAAAACLGVFVSGCAARGPAAAPAPSSPSSPPTENEILNEFQPDRPDVANGTHVVPIAVAQLEAGGQWAHVAAGQQSAITPLSLRIGLRDWLEARIETQGLDYERDANSSSLGLDGLQLGAKIRFAEPFAIMPAVNLPAGVKTGTDYSLTFIGGTDFGGSNHVDANYAVAAAGADAGHFFQQWAAVSVNRQVTDRLSPYAEVYWFSRQDPGGDPIVGTDTGFIFTVNERFAFDGGIYVGLSHAAPRTTLFAGLTTLLGELHGGRGVHGRLRDAAVRHRGQQP